VAAAALILASSEAFACDEHVKKEPAAKVAAGGCGGEAKVAGGCGEAKAVSGGGCGEAKAAGGCGEAKATEAAAAKKSGCCKEGGAVAQKKSRSWFRATIHPAGMAKVVHGSAVKGGCGEAKAAKSCPSTATETKETCPAETKDTCPTEKKGCEEAKPAPAPAAPISSPAPASKPPCCGAAKP
jgi:hypothetical protein